MNDDAESPLRNPQPTAGAHRLRDLAAGRIDVAGEHFDHLDCRGLRFCTRVSFRGCRFGGVAWFDGATFQDGADFSEAVFENDLRLDGAAFLGPASFARADFRGVACLDRCRFAGPLVLDDANVSAHLSAAGARMEGAVSMRNAEFWGGFWAGGLQVDPLKLRTKGLRVHGRMFTPAAFNVRAAGEQSSRV